MKRIQNSYQTLLYDFMMHDISVICPKCASHAIVKPGQFTLANRQTEDIKVSCFHCGFHKKLVTESTSDKKGLVFVFGGAIDPFFYFPLWYQTEAAGNILWAYHLQHLAFLQEHIEAKLRERNGQALRNKSIGSRLPRWMTSRNNRELILRKIKELQKK